MYNQRNLYSGNRPSALADQGSITGSRPSAWTEQGSTTGNRPSAWTQQESVAGNRASTWTEQGKATGNRSSAWTEQGSASGNRPSAWTQQESVAGNRASTWTEQGSATGNRSSAWTEQGSASENRPSVRGEQGLVAGNRASTWTHQESLYGKRASAWTEQESSTGNRPSAWTQQESVAGNRASTWTEQRSTTGNRPSAWAEQGSATGNRPSTWAEQGSATGSRPSAWTEQGSATENRPSAWTEQGSATGNRHSAWTEQESVAGNRPSVWTPQESVAGNRVSAWREQDSATGNRPSAWTSQESAARKRGYEDNENYQKAYDRSTYQQYSDYSGDSVDYGHAQQRQQGVYDETGRGVGHPAVMKRSGAHVRPQDTYTRDTEGTWHDKKPTREPYYNEEPSYDKGDSVYTRKMESSVVEYVKIKKLKVEESSYYQSDNTQTATSESKQRHPSTDGYNPHDTTHGNQQHSDLTNTGETTPVLSPDVTNSLVKKLDLSSILNDNQFKNLKSIFDNLKSPDKSPTVKYEQGSVATATSGVIAQQTTELQHSTKQHEVPPWQSQNDQYSNQQGQYRQHPDQYQQQSKQLAQSPGQYYQTGQNQLQGQYQPQQTGQYQQTGQNPTQQAGQYQKHAGQYQQTTGQFQQQVGQHQPQQAGPQAPVPQQQTRQYRTQHAGQQQAGPQQQTGQYQQQAGEYQQQAGPQQQTGQYQTQAGEYQQQAGLQQQTRQYRPQQAGQYQQQAGQHQQQLGQYQPQQARSLQQAGQYQPPQAGQYEQQGRQHQQQIGQYQPQQPGSQQQSGQYRSHQAAKYQPQLSVQYQNQEQNLQLQTVQQTIQGHPQTAQHTSPGQLISPGQHTSPGQLISPGQHTSPGQLISPGQHTSPGQLISPGQHTSPGQPQYVGQQPYQRQNSSTNIDALRTKPQQLTSETDFMVTLSQDANFTFNLQPPPLPEMIISVKKLDSCEMFTVKDGTTLSIKNEEYKDRVTYQQGDCQYGVFKFTLKNVKYDDEGMYVVSYGNYKSDVRHLKISITVYTCNGEDIILRWRIPPTEINDMVYVNRTRNSKTVGQEPILKAYGKVAEISEQYTHRLKFTGNTLNGVMELSLSNCKSNDYGMYMSSCNGNEVKGKQLFIKDSNLKKKSFQRAEDRVVMVGGNVSFSWYIQPTQSINAVVKVTKKDIDEVPVMAVSDSKVKVEDPYIKRARFNGNLRQGIMVLSITDCKSLDEGVYSAQVYHKEFPGPKLETSTLICVKPGDTADFYWNMKSCVKEVKVYKANGPTLFVACGPVVAITEEYKSRISYHGNTVYGFMHFVLSGCTVFDNGFYTASCNGMMHGGKLLHVEDPKNEIDLKQHPGLTYAMSYGRSSFLYSDYCFINEMACIREKAGETVLYDKKVITTRVKEFDTALLCWQIKPLPEDTMVKVYRLNEDDPLFVASGKMAIEHSKRVKFTGDTTQGLIEFMLSDCTREDSGSYHSSHDIKNFQGKKLCVIGHIRVSDVAVVRKDDAVLKWSIEPASESTQVKVYRKDGGTLFTITDNHVNMSPEYKDRVNYTGDISDGVMEFTLSCCQYEDEGFYVASYDGFDFNGPRLKIKLPPSQDVDVGLGDTARVKFYIRPQSSQTLVSVKKNIQEVIFTVYGSKAYYIKPYYKGRLLFVGDATEGVIEFTIENCNYQEEGEYIAVVAGSATNHEQLFPGPKLKLDLPPPPDVHVAMDAIARIKWYIKPVPHKPNTCTVTVYMVNGQTLFTVYGDTPYITSGYQDRVEYTGNVMMGVMEFTLKNCLHGDGGQYAASYDDKVYLGPKLCLREIPVQDIITSLTETAVFKWFIKPPPEGAWVTVSNRDGEVLFVVMGNFTDIRESYKGRLQVSGNIHKGVIEFLLTKCNYVDEGTYIATYADQNFIGPKLIISLVVGDRDAAPICWKIIPVPQGEAVKVFRKNGLQLFTAKGSNAEIMEEYKQRLIFTGDTRTGKIDFVLQDCSHGDTGLYVSVYNDDVHDGRHLKVRFLDDEMEKKKAVIKVKLAITMECLERQKCENVETKFKDAYTAAGLPVFCHYQQGEVTFPSLTTRVIAPAVTGIMTVGDYFRIPLTYAFGKSEGEVKKNLFDKAASLLKSKDIDQILNTRNLKPSEFGGASQMSKAHKVEYYYKTSDDVCKLLSNLDSQESQRVFMSQLLEDSTVNNDMFGKAARLLYDCRRISLLEVVTAIRLREINKSKRISSSTPSLDELMKRDDVHSNVLELSSISPNKQVSDLVLTDYLEEKQRLLGAFNCLSESTKSCGLLLLWSTKLVYGSITPVLPRPVYRCIIWIHGKQVAEAFSVGRKFSIQLAAAEALAYLYHSQPVIQRIDSDTKCMYSYTADKILNEADLLNKTLTYNERVLLICEGLILHYKKTGEATLDALEFYPGLPEYVYDNMKDLCTKNNLIYHRRSGLSRDGDGPVVTISQKLDPYKIVTQLGKHNGQYGTYRLIPAVERVNIAREILMKTKDELELFSEDYKL